MANEGRCVEDGDGCIFTGTGHPHRNGLTVVINLQGIACSSMQQDPQDMA